MATLAKEPTQEMKDLRRDIRAYFEPPAVEARAKTDREDDTFIELIRRWNAMDNPEEFKQYLDADDTKEEVGR